LSNYDRFRDRTSIETSVTSDKTADFIGKSKSSRTIVHSRTNTNRTAVLTNQYREGADEWILFTSLEKSADNNIRIGDYIVAGNVNYLVYEEYNHPQKEHYLKHRVLECNVQVKIDGISQYGSYISSARAYAKMATASSGQLSFVMDDLEPILITVNNENIRFGNRIMIGTTDAFEIQSVDRITNQGIMYLSLKSASINEFANELADGAAKTPTVADNTVLGGQIEAGTQFTIDTNFAYALFNVDVVVVSKALTSVIIEVPFGIDELQVTTKNADGDTLPPLVYEVV